MKQADLKELLMSTTNGTLRINWFRSTKESLIGNPLATVLIRKTDMKMYKYSCRYKNVERIFASNPN